MIKTINTRQLWVIGLLVGSLLFSLVAPMTALAAPANDQKNPTVVGKSFLYYQWLQACFNKHAKPDVNSGNINAYQWFDSGTEDIGRILESDSQADCGNSTSVGNALRALGWESGSDAAAKLYDVTITGNAQSTTTSYKLNKTKALNNLASTYWGLSSPKLKPQESWWIYRNTLNLSCQPKKLSNGAKAATGETEIKLQDIDLKTGAVTEASYAVLADESPTTTSAAGGPTVVTPGSKNTVTVFNGSKHTCKELADLANGFAKSAGAAIAKDSTIGDAMAANMAASSEASDPKETCNITGVGWLVCPVATLISNIIDATYSLVEGLLVFTPTKNLMDTKNPIYAVWSNVLNLANIAFIVVFFVVIFSQATSIGISAYGVRKMLPRIIIAAILVNLSYYICIFGIDLSNIIGAGIDGIISSGLANGAGVSSDPATVAGTATGLGLGVLTAGLLAGGVAASGGIVAALGGLLIFIVPILLAVLTALLVLVARQAFLILLIVVAPLAFAAYILPNTEKFFDVWRKAFIAMLIFYPLVAVIFSGSKLAASVLRLSANSGDVNDQLIKVFSIGVQVIPLFALPFLMRFSGGVLSRVAGIVNNPNKGPFDALRRNMEGRRDMIQNRAKTRALGQDTPDFSGRFGRTRRLGNSWLTASGAAKRQASRDYQNSLSKGIAEEASQEYIAAAALNSATGPAFAQRMAGSSNPQHIAAVQASAQATADKLERQSIANREVLYRAKIDPGDLDSMQSELLAASRGGDATAVKALQNIMVSNGSAGMDTLRTSTEEALKAGADDTMVKAMKKNLQETHGQVLKQKSADMLYWSTDTGNKDFASYHSKNAASWEALSDAEIASQSAKSLAAAVSAGAVSSNRAKKILDDPRLNANLGGKQIESLKSALALSEADRAKIKQDFAASTHGPSI